MNIGRIKNSIAVTPEGCWEWQKSCSSAGYGQLTENRKYWSAHKYAYLCVNGELKDGEVVRHKCHNKKCCNPDHLTKGSQADNWRDSEEVHRAATRKSRKIWNVQGVSYPTARHALKATGISSTALVKFTDADTRVFDVDAYRKGCRIAGWDAKI